MRYLFQKPTAASRLRKSLVSTLVALAAFLVIAAPAQAQALPPSLQGELFTALEGTSSGPIGSIEMNDGCMGASAGETYTVTYTATGVAGPPYPGTFTESGTVTVLLDEISNVPSVLSWTASFTIDSPVGDVTGTKTLNDPELLAICFGNPGFFYQSYAEAVLDYEATIKPPGGGTFHDAGSADVVVTHSICAALPIGLCLEARETEFFQELFLLSTGVLPLDTSGKATGGGLVISGSNPFERVTFGFNVRKSEDESRLHGTCNVLDHATLTHVKCLTVTHYQQIGNTATWEGTAEVDGVEEDYRITVQDNGEPNQGIDMFSLDTESYDVPLSPVTHGNVQLHKQNLAAVAP
jgi:hypothetical protein